MTSDIRLPALPGDRKRSFPGFHGQGFVSYGEGIPQRLPGTFGGETKLKISLDNGASGMLTITCLLGTPPAGKMEGISVILGSSGQFTKADGGDNIFIGL